MRFFEQAATAACLPWLVASVYNEAFIVEFDGSREWTAEALLSQTQISLANSGLDCKASQRYYFAHPVFQGASFNIECANDGTLSQSVLSTVKAIDGVGKAWPMTNVAPAAPHVVGKVRTRGIPDVGRETLGHGSEKRDLSRTSGALNARDGTVPRTPPQHVDTGVAKLHAENLTGTGIRVAVVDTGFDVDVPALSQTNIGYSWDLTDGDNDVRETCGIHGTHVLSIIAAKGDEGKYGVLGVAPDATFELYRIANCLTSGGTVTDLLVAGFLKAAERSPDIISCSWAGGLAFPEDLWSSVATRLFNNGTYVTMSAGNKGPGPLTGQSPGSGADDIAGIGSSDNSMTPYYTWGSNWTAGDETGSFRFVPGTPYHFPANEKLTVLTLSNMETTGCMLLPEKPDLPADMSRVILLAPYNQCWKAANDTLVSLSSAFGITYILYYQSSNFTVSTGRLYYYQWAEDVYDPNVKGMATIDFETATRLLEIKDKHGSLELSIPHNVSVADVDVSFVPNNRTGLLATKFTSWGPTLRGGGSPTYLAPGGNILGAFLGETGGYGVVSGTSMAAPFAAGVAALVKQQHPDYSPQDINAVIATTAHPVKWNDGNGIKEDFLAPVLQQGGGLVDAWAAVHTTTVLNTTSLSFNDTNNRPKELTFTIRNTGQEALTYQLSHVGASSGYFLERAGDYELVGQDVGQLRAAEVYPVYAEVSISPSTLSVNPGDTATVSVSITKNPDLSEAATRLSHFGGFIAIEAEGATEVKSLSLPYTGFGAPLAVLPNINRSPNETILSYFNITNNVATEIESGRVFTCTSLNYSAELPASFEGGLYPNVQLSLFVQSRNTSISIVDATTHAVVMTPFQSSSAQMWGWKGSWYWDGSDSNNTYLPAGTYYWNVRVLRLGGNVAEEESFDIFDSGNWTLVYLPNITLPSQ